MEFTNAGLGRVRSLTGESFGVEVFIRYLLPPPRRLCIGRRLFVICLSAGLRKKTTQQIFRKFGIKVAHRPWKKSLDFGGNPDRIGLGLGLGLGLGGDSAILLVGA